MKIIEVKVLFETEASRDWLSTHDASDLCPRSLLVTRPTLINLDDMSSAFPDKDKRVTFYVAKGDCSSLIAMSYEEFKKIVL